MAGLSQTNKAQRNIFPNPACPGSLVNYSGSDIEMARLIDMKGKEIMRFSAGQEIYLPQEIKAGTYLLQLHSTTLISNHTLIVVE
jgi:hypothetical protein